MEKKNGKAKEYNDKGKLTFEGEYVNGKRGGKIKEYNKKGDIIFEGEYINGEINGKIREYFSHLGNGSIFGFEYFNGRKRSYYILK